MYTYFINIKMFYYGIKCCIHLPYKHQNVLLWNQMLYNLPLNIKMFYYGIKCCIHLSYKHQNVLLWNQMLYTHTLLTSKCCIMESNAVYTYLINIKMFYYGIKCCIEIVKQINHLKTGKKNLHIQEYSYLINSKFTYNDILICVIIL